MNEPFYDAPRPACGRRPADAPRAQAPILDAIGVDLTALAAAGRLKPVIGREREAERVIAVLAKDRKNNPILVGEPGVGKTAIAEKLALRIVEGSVPDFLLDSRLVALEVSALTAGAGMKGEFEARLRDVIEEVERADGEIVLFVDEIHVLLGAGNAEGGLDAANILKPSLARGAFRCIGATTAEEYRKYFERDKALVRRFQAVQVDEPSPEETIRIVEGIRPDLERSHGIAIPPERVAEAVRLADVYVRDRKRPDKVIDLIDESAADRKLSPEPADPFAVREIAELRARIQEAENSGNAPEALRLRAILSLYAGFPQAEDVPALSSEDLNRTIHRWKGVVPDGAAADTLRLFDVEERLLARIHGQDAALAAVAGRLVRSGLASTGRRPLASFLFLGPTGVGKTETALAVAAEFLGDAAALARLDMSEFQEPHSVARIVGSPPGYVGYRDAGALAQKVMDRPAVVVLVDEIEKAHPRVLDLFLQILEDGRLTDGAGRVVDFSRTIVVFTSNLRVEKSPAGLRAALGTALRPELVNRIDEVLEFQPLGREALEEIARREIARVVAPFRERLGWRVRVAPAVLSAVVNGAGGVESGARGLRRATEQVVGDQLSRTALEGGGPDVAVGFALFRVVEQCA